MDSISIGKLSKEALKKLEKGLPVRVKAEDGHTLELAAKKAAKLKKAFDKAKGMTLQLDEKEVAKSLGAGLYAQGGGLYAQSSPVMHLLYWSHSYFYSLHHFHRQAFLAFDHSFL